MIPTANPSDRQVLTTEPSYYCTGSLRLTDYKKTIKIHSCIQLGLSRTPRNDNDDIIYRSYNLKHIDAFLIQASTTLENLAEFSEESGDNYTYSRLIQLYTQALLDITYFEENQLVDEEFPEESSLQKVEELIGALSEPENLVNESGIFQEPLEVLGIELLECLYWRRGALIYMFCHTVKGRKEWLRKETDLLKKFLKEGIHYLRKMLDFRYSNNPNEEFVVQDTGTAILVNEGIFSDTHLLAMMYCGEMCYWGLKYCGDQGTELHRELPGSSENIIMDFQEIGEKMLTKYITVCEGPLRSHGWDTKNAKRILDYFKQLSS